MTQRYEHKVVSAHYPEGVIEQMEKEGWELVSIMQEDRLIYKLFFKRPYQQEKQADARRRKTES